MKCCKRNPIIKINGNPLCKKHFISHYEKNFEKIIKKFENKKLLVAVSGGKDSMATLFLINKFSEKYNIKFEAVFVNLGIPRFSEESEKIVKDFCKEKNIKLNIILAEKEIASIKKIAEIKLKNPRLLPKPICSYCGLIKRYLLNKFAYENGFDYIVLGHNLDDELAFIFMNSLNQDISQLARTGIKTETIKELKLIGRIKPLYYLTEKENLIYCLINSIPFYEGKCPHSQNASQIKIKHIINYIEKEKPGFKINFLKTFLKLKENLKVEKENVKPCEVCGYPTTTRICSFCRLKKTIEEYEKSK